MSVNLFAISRESVKVLIFVSVAKVFVALFSRIIQKPLGFLFLRIAIIYDNIKLTVAGVRVVKIIYSLYMFSYQSIR